MQDIMVAERQEQQHLALSDSEVISWWLSTFDAALKAGDAQALGELFQSDSHWRDLFAITWNLTPTNGRDDIVATLLRWRQQVRPRNFRIAKGHVAPRRVRRTGLEVIEAIFEFETETGIGLGVMRVEASRPRQVWTISTSLRQLKGLQEPINERRPDGSTTRVFGGEAWAKQRERVQRFDDREPAVLIVGGGHNGLVLSARLRMLGVESLVIERSPNVGDVWRRRYAALALHNEIVLNHMPYMPFPATWPKYLPKDMLGNWLEAYAIALECNVWTGSVFTGARFDEASGTWSATVKRADGSERVLHPKHVVFANGIVGEPNIPDMLGLNAFKGEVTHAQGFDSGAPWRGKNVLVVGVGNSAHDIAQDLHGHGAHVKMVQRGSIAVFSVKSASLNHSIYYNEGLSLEDADLIASSNTFPVILRGYQLSTQRMLDIDKKLLSDLHKKGFKLNIGPEGGGHQMHVRKNHGGYYLNVGCSELIVNGQIGLIQYEDIERFTEDGVRLKDGSTEKVDLVVMATGYRPPSDVVCNLLGEEIAEKIGPVWGLDRDGEMCNMYKPTPQKGLWFIGGGFAQSRIWSHYVALQIKAREAGIVKDGPIPRPVLDTRIGPAQPYELSLQPSNVDGPEAGTDGL
ncbi:4-hydroxyacetophenone monooxygenase [Achromobacter xylosoxidans]|uniref:flavin-containing monooxygenase n=1 Tax=Alcaligenes xylosoxydans xylosoxydans TaxID=85698 RepID=UPI0006C37395|nr:NAD(P)/FAD-dependent oxidoreductase [Achromobacter xylosoxidans]CUJ65855.1 4-hydroxyacetophenone monooxygenase [Achromobacter xylosoxidans]